uniref:ATP-dependent DNA helicase n=1 Tax=Octopus bimaculoides TaxID=37653 RepID=A0A0L8FTQ3_OCTBM
MDFLNNLNPLGLPMHRISLERQFPIKLAFSFTANKSQGQTLDRVGVFLSTLMFTHGQSYVTMSRALDSDNLKISVNQTQNIVYKEVL